MNVVILSGRMSRDLNVNGKTATGTIAVTRPFPFGKDKDGNDITDFLMLKFIGEKNVERAEKYLLKGVKIDVRGIVCRDSWQDDGEWKEFNYIIVQEWEFAESKKVASQSDSVTSTASADDAFMNVNDDVEEDGIPFS